MCAEERNDHVRDGVERRAWPRVQRELPVTVTAGGGTGPVQGRTFDVSEGGMGLLLDGPIRPGTACLLSITMPDGSVLPHLAATAVWCSRPSAGQNEPHCVGFAFTDLSLEAQAAIEEVL